MIVDASVIVKWFVTEPGHGEARSILRDTPELVVPSLALTEVANVFWLKVQRGEMLDAGATRALAVLLDGAALDVRPTSPLLPSALELAGRLDHPVYDCVYLALAVGTGQPLITADRRLAGVASSVDVDVRLLTPDT